MAPPANTQAVLQISDSHLGVHVAFAIDRHLAPGTFSNEESEAAYKSLQETEAKEQPSGCDRTGIDNVPGALPAGFGHAFATRFQVRSRHSPRPPGERPAERGRKPQGVPWSAWAESADADLFGTATVQEATHMTRHSVNLVLPNGVPLEYGAWYQTSVRISDGVCWSDWSEPSAPVKVFVAPPKPECPDSDELSVDRSTGGNNVKVRWPPLRAHGGLRLIEYALFVREVLHDRSELCARHLATLILGNSAKTQHEAEGDIQQKREMMTYELRDLRQDVTYIFTLASRYPNIGPREFDDALNSTPTSLRPVFAPLPVPCQLPLPPERLRRMQGMRCVLLKWSFQGLPASMAKDESDAQIEKLERQYDLQALPEGAKDNEWVLCKSVAKTKIDGAVAWFVKDVPGQTLRSRFRLWERDTGRFGRTSPLMLSLLEPVQKVGVMCVIAESAAQILLRAPLDARHGSHEFVCRYQVRYKPEQMNSEWTELPIQMLWHRQNDHLASLDVPVDAQGAVISGLPTGAADAADHGRRGGAAAQREATAASNTEQNPEEPYVVRTPQLPTIPLATVSPAGEVAQQHCLVATLREEDGLLLNQSYTFSVRVGDLYRLSDWSEPSAAVKLAVPQAQMESTLSDDEARIRISGLTDSSLTATWPQFFPATHAGVPRHVEVEYLLTVAPQAPKRRLAGRGAPEEAAPKPHSQWLLSSTASSTDTAEEALSRTMNIAVLGLKPHTAYELKLAVRYARLGLRKWNEALSVIVTTKKPDAESLQKQAMETARVKTAPAVEETSPFSKRRVAVNLESGKIDSRGYKQSPARVPDSPRGFDSKLLEINKLPPLPQVAAKDPLDLAHLNPSIPHPNVEEWMEATQAGAERVTAGMALTGGDFNAGATTTVAPGNAEFPQRPADFVPFWRRDPMEGRPSMPQMPSNAHSAMQLDLVGRSTSFPPAAAAPLVPRPPNSENTSGRVHRPAEVERVAYPRRYYQE